MSEQEPQSRESIESSRNAETLAPAERQDVSPAELEAHKAEQGEQLKEAKDKLDRLPDPQTKAGENEKSAPATHPTNLDKKAAYWDTLRSVQRKLPSASRNFSKFIHAPAVEKTSEVVGATIARPSILLGATATAALLGGFLYITARLYGFSLSGSEFILSLVIGGVLGLLIEAVGKVFKRKA